VVAVVVACRDAFMSLTLISPRHFDERSWVELRWSWELASEGRRIVFRNPHEARRYLLSLGSLSEQTLAVREFLHHDAPWLSPARDEHELLERLSSAIVAGRITLHERSDDARDKSRFCAPYFEMTLDPGRAPAASLAEAAPLPEPPEEVCWPCRRAAASARTLREASATGAPFISDLGRA
jgi:hypothetical protein